ncbi:hypothetical protein ACIQPT_28020 [Streptomyces sp. NPDC091289]|uniref:hypothetical protein n=1 Tax=Streptomyces sp. NPDC091289 TaxID=3365989 RepID=UPI0037FB96A0
MLVHAANRARALTRLRNLGLRAVYLRGNDRPPTPDEVTAVLHHPDGLLWRAAPQEEPAGLSGLAAQSPQAVQSSQAALSSQGPESSQAPQSYQSLQSCQELWHPIRALLGSSGYAGPARPAA